MGHRFIFSSTGIPGGPGVLSSFVGGLGFRRQAIRLSAQVMKQLASLGRPPKARAVELEVASGGVRGERKLPNHKRRHVLSMYYQAIGPDSAAFPEAQVMMGFLL